MGLTVQFYVEVTTWHFLVYPTANSGIFVLFETEQYISHSFDKNSMCEKEKGSQITIEHQSILAIHKGRLITLPNSGYTCIFMAKKLSFSRLFNCAT